MFEKKLGFDPPTWALLTVVRLHAEGYVTTAPDYPAKYVITDAGWTRLGRRPPTRKAVPA